ncbi:hypothetical protein GCM10027268_14890 [Brachybacterium huguangmaarense]
MLSDRTRTGFGRRAPWIVMGTLSAAILLVCLAATPPYWALLALWSLSQSASYTSVNAVLALAPDTAPTRQYGVISGILGMTYTLGVVVGTLVSTSLGIGPAYVVSAALLLALTAQFLLRPDARRPAPDELDPAGGPRHPDADFAWVFAARFTVNLGNFIALFYLLYYLRDRIGVADPDTGVLILTGVYAVCVLVTAVIAGTLSDLWRLRRPFVSTSAVGVAVASLVMAFAPSFAVVVVAAALLGLSWGVFSAVDQALVNEVLPREASRARDVGIMNVAVAGANVASPLLAAFALHWLGGYPGLYVLSAALVAIGAVMVRGGPGRAVSAACGGGWVWCRAGAEVRGSAGPTRTGRAALQYVAPQGHLGRLSGSSCRCGATLWAGVSLGVVAGVVGGRAFGVGRARGDRGAGLVLRRGVRVDESGLERAGVDGHGG